jgi:hypothetical protein
VNPEIASVDGLKKFLQPTAAHQATVCELCDVAIEDAHSHLVDLTFRSLLCVCRPCGLLFASTRAVAGRWRLVPDRCLALGSGGDAAWDLLDIPVGVAFCFHNSALGAMALIYPGPAGATESQLPLDAWGDIVSAHPVLSTLEPDVEALLVRRAPPPAVSFVVPIDACYELVGLMRRHWKGFDGGPEARRHLDEFFERIRARAV